MYLGREKFRQSTAGQFSVHGAYTIFHHKYPEPKILYFRFRATTGSGTFGQSMMKNSLFQDL